MTALANPTRWRTHPYNSDVKVWLDAPTVAFAARVNQASFSYPIIDVLFDTVTVGAYTDISVGMTVLFGSTAGADDLGRTYVRTAANMTGLRIGRSEQGVNDGEVNLSDNAYITVLNDFRAWSKVPSIGSLGVRQTDSSRDFATYKKLPPIILLNCGLGVQADVNSGTGKATFSFVASSSYATEPGATIASYAYTLPSGATVTGGATNTHTVTFTLSQGIYWLHLLVTDSNGTTQIRHVRLIAENNSNIEGWELQPYEYGDDGQTISLKLIAPVPVATYPEGTGLYVWHKESYNGVAGSLAGPVGSEHMLFGGWLDTESSNTSGTDKGVLSDTTLKAIDAAVRAKQLMIVPVSTGNDLTPASWDEMAAADPDKLMIRTAHEYSTLLTLCDFRWSGAGAGYPFTRLDSSGGSLWDVLAGYAHALNGSYVLTGDEWGMLAVIIDPQLVDSATRTTTVIVDLNETDWSGIKAGRDRAARYRFLWGKSTVPSTAQAADTTTLPTANAVAPGLSGAPGIQERTETGFLATSAGLVRYLKHLYARLTTPNNQFVIDLAHGGNAGISPAAKQWVRFTQSAANAAPRGWTWTTARMLPLKVRVSYDAPHGLMTRSVTVEKETVGVAAVAFTPKQRREYSVTNPTPPGLNFGTPLPPVYDPRPILPPGALPIKAVLIDWQYNKIARATSYSLTTGGVWVLCDNTSIVTGNYHDICADPYNYARYFVVTSTGLWRCDDIWNAPDAWTHVATETTISGTAGLDIHKINMSINDRGYILVRFGTSSVAYSTDYGVTWTRRNGFTGAVNTTDDILYTRGPALSAMNNPGASNQGWAYMNQSGSPGHVWQTKDWGQSWASIANITFAPGAGWSHIPYKRGGGSDNQNDSAQYLFVYGLGVLLKVTAAGVVTTLDGLTPLFRLSNSGALTDGQYLLTSYTFDGDKLAAVSVGNGATPAAPFLSTSEDGGVTWTVHAPYSTSGNNQVVGVNGWPNDPNDLIMWGKQAVVATFDRGVTLVDISGNLPTVVGTFFQPRVVLFDLSDYIPAS